MFGRIAKVKSEAGYGFINGDGESAGTFFHASQVVPKHAFYQLDIGARVEYEVEQSEKGPRAINVRPVEGD